MGPLRPAKWARKRPPDWKGGGDERILAICGAPKGSRPDELPKLRDLNAPFCKPDSGSPTCGAGEDTRCETSAGRRPCPYPWGRILPLGPPDTQNPDKWRKRTVHFRGARTAPGAGGPRPPDLARKRRLLDARPRAPNPDLAAMARGLREHQRRLEQNRRQRPCAQSLCRTRRLLGRRGPQARCCPRRSPRRLHQRPRRTHAGHFLRDLPRLLDDPPSLRLRHAELRR